jgi:membrane protein implicated in regulation of membrane protease activity
MTWVPLVWLVIALALAGAEVLTGDLFLLMISGGALAAAGSSLIFDELWIDGVVFAVVSMLLLVLVRPALRRRFAVGTGLLDRAKELEGKVWTARPLNDNDVFEPGDHVTVMHIDGATAVVYRGV